MADDIIIVNQPLRRRESTTGRVRYTIEMRSQPLVFNLDPRQMGKPPADAMAAELRARVQDITADAAPATLKAREVAAHAYAAGKPWARRRYSGGKLGAMPPNQSRRAFNDSGRFVKGIVVGAARDKWIVNVPANRLDPTAGNVDRIWARLISLVPAFADVKLLFDSAAVREGVRLGLDAAIAKAPMTTDEISLARAKALLAIVARVLLEAAAA